MPREQHPDDVAHAQGGREAVVAPGDQVVVQLLQARIPKAPGYVGPDGIRDPRPVEQALDRRHVRALGAREVAEDPQGVLGAQHAVDIAGEFLFLAHVDEAVLLRL